MTAPLFDPKEVIALGESLGKVSGKAVPLVTEAVQTVATAMTLAWQANASATSGRSGYEYPGSITSEMKPGLGSIGAELGPQEGVGQGGIGRGFEYGSAHQPPHLDGQKAFDATADQLPTLLAAAAGKALGEL